MYNTWQLGPGRGAILARSWVLGAYRQRWRGVRAAPTRKTAQQCTFRLNHRVETPTTRNNPHRARQVCKVEQNDRWRSRRRFEPMLPLRQHVPPAALRATYVVVWRCRFACYERPPEPGTMKTPQARKKNTPKQQQKRPNGHRNGNRRAS